MLDGDFTSGDESKKTVLQYVENGILGTAKAWRSNADEFGQLHALYKLWLPKAKEAGIPIKDK